MPATNYSNVGFSTNLAQFPLIASAATGSNGIGWLQAHENRAYLERMVARRAVPINADLYGGCDAPLQSHPWVGGGGGPPFVTSAALNGDGTITFAVSGVTWFGGTDDVSGHSYANPWTGTLTSPSTGWIPSNWWVVIDDPNFDWPKCLKSQVTGWTNTGTITCPDKPFLDAVACCVIPSIAYLVGRPVKIIAHDAIDRSDRVLEFPNDPQFATGNVLSYPANTNVTPALPATPTLVAGPGTNHTLIFRSTNVGSFVPLAGMDLRTTDTSGYVQSWQISGTSTAAVAYAVGTGTANANVGSAFCVVHHGARAYPGRAPSFPYNAYRGVVGGYATHDFQLDRLSSASMPLKTVGVPTELPGPPPTCQDEPQQVYDRDYKTSYDGGEDPGSYEDCSRPYDHIYAPDFHKTIHGLQSDLLAFCAGYAEDKDWTGIGATDLPNFNQAECARVAATNLAGIPGVAQTFDLFTLTTGSLVSSGEIHVSGSGTNVLPYRPMGAWYSIRRADGSYNGGYGYFGTAGTLIAGPVGPGNAAGTFTSGADDSRDILVWPGFSLFIRNQVRGLCDQPGVFIADRIVPDVGDPYAQDPPSPIQFTNAASTLGVGRFIPRAKSQHATDRLVYTADPGDVQGFAREGGNTNTALVVGAFYRWNGDAFFAPSVKASDAGAFLLPDDVQAPYYEQYWNGRLSDAHQPLRDALRSGTATAGGTNWVRVPSCDTFNLPTPNGAAMLLYTNSGTATSGSTTGFADSVAGAATNSASAYWASIRFPGFGGSYVSFGAEIDHGTGTYRGTFNPQFTEARLIATGATNATVTWATPMSASANGKPWRIREPRILHPWYGHKMLLNPGTNGGSPAVVTNTGSCGDIQFFDAGTNTITVGPGWSVKPADDLPGPVMRYHGTAAADLWTPASGSDTARLGVTNGPHDFTDHYNYNLEGYSKRYGNFIEGAAVCPELLNELWAYAKALRAVNAGAGTYTAKPSFGGTAIANVASASVNYGFPSGGGTNVADGSPRNLNINGTPQNISITQTCNGVSSTIYTGNDVTAAVAAKYGCAESKSTNDGATPFATGGGAYSGGSFGAGNVTATTTASYIRISGLPYCRDVGSPRCDFYGFAFIDQANDAPASATCVGTNIGSTSFSATTVPLLYRAWSKMTSAGSSSGSATSSLIGSLSQPEIGTFPSCIGASTPPAPTGNLFSGWYLGRNTVLTVYDFIDT